MSASQGIRCRLPKEICLQCPYEQCIYDLYDEQKEKARKDYILAVYDDFTVHTFANTTESAKWLMEKEQNYDKKVGTVSSNIRTAIRRNKKMCDISWFRLNDSTELFFKYALQKSIMYIKHDDNKKAWAIVKRVGGHIEQITQAIYATKEIAQVVLDTYADDNGLRLVI